MIERETIAVGEAARRLGVSVATIKRWVTKGVLAAVRTGGGHRRILLADLHRLVNQDRARDLAHSDTAWLDAMFEGNTAELVALLERTRAQHLSWCGAADEVASIIAKLGQAWEVGDCTIYEEHVASEALRRAITISTEKARQSQTGRRAVLLTVAEERHTLGLALAELILTECGWQSIWVGEGPPVREVLPMMQGLLPRVVVLSASAQMPRRLVLSYESAVHEGAKNVGANVVVAGGAAWEVTQNHHRAYNFSQFGKILSALV